MTPDFIEASAAVITVIGGVITWLWRVASSTAKAHVTLGIFTSDMASLKADTRELRDNHIRTDTLIQTVMTQLSKLDKVDQLVSSVEVMRAVVERLEKRIDREDHRP